MIYKKYFRRLKKDIKLEKNHNNLYNIKLMDPISNKKEFNDLTVNLRDLAYSYLEKYNPSKQQIKTYLLKKYLKKFRGQKVKKEITEIIDNIVANKFRKKSFFK